MSATLGAILKQLEPDWTIRIFEASQRRRPGKLERLEQLRHRPFRAVELNYILGCR